MAFGIRRSELEEWKNQVREGQIAYLTHYWIDPRFPSIKSVTKVGCSDLKRLQNWCKEHDLDPKYIHHRNPFPHFDLLGPRQKEILKQEMLHHHIQRFKL
ncbi:hypothetical protein [Paenibacillus sp. Marseille-Q4541]|uniref:hypothetical protein n=1 Tax=Paenibacillus sp. Marseille-Q4541 TaxID=2831522 RepID=UPI001BA4D8D7|nr:hypothetical protein [Paenibacillus sp. Marseille-Q4541]